MSLIHYYTTFWGWDFGEAHWPSYWGELRGSLSMMVMMPKDHMDSKSLGSLMEHGLPRQFSGPILVCRDYVRCVLT